MSSSANKQDSPISVVMPVYNAKRYLKEAIESVLNQTYPHFEFIIVDDGSTDKSLDILKQYKNKDPRIRIISRSNTGIVGALNDGIEAAQGEFIARMDADDIALPARFNRQLELMNSDPNLVILGTNFYFIDKSGNIVKSGNVPREHDKIVENILKGNGGAIIHPTAMIRKDILMKVGGYREEAQFTEDLDLYHRLSRVGEMANLDEVLFKYRIHFNSVNATRFMTRQKTFLWVMKEAYTARGMVFNENTINSKLNEPQSRSNNHRDWAITSFEFGSRLVPLKHALVACAIDPLHEYSWKCLSYVVKRIFKII